MSKVVLVYWIVVRCSALMTRNRVLRLSTGSLDESPKRETVQRNGLDAFSNLKIFAGKV
jgi:hypothetical protein